jgi:hypothetical protein
MVIMGIGDKRAGARMALPLPSRAPAFLFCVQPDKADHPGRQINPARPDAKILIFWYNLAVEAEIKPEVRTLENLGDLVPLLLPARVIMYPEYRSATKKSREKCC